MKSGLLIALAVGIIDSKDKAAIVMTCPKPIEEGGAHPPNVHITSRAGGEACANGHGGERLGKKRVERLKSPIMNGWGVRADFHDQNEALKITLLKEIRVLTLMRMRENGLFPRTSFARSSKGR